MNKKAQQIVLALDNITTQNALSTALENIERRAESKPKLKKLLTKIFDNSFPILNSMFYAQKVDDLVPIMHQYIHPNTKLHIFEYPSQMANAFTIPTSVFIRSPKASIVSAFPFISLLTTLKYVLLNIWRRDLDISKEIILPLDIKLKQVSMFYADSCVSKLKMSEKELISILLHEIGHNTFRRSNSVSFIISLLSFFLVMGVSVITTGLGNAFIELLIILITILAAILIRHAVSRKLEYKSDSFAAKLGLGNELKTALQKLYHQLSPTELADEKLAQQAKEIEEAYKFIYKWGLTSHPSNEDRFANIDKTMQESSLYLSEGVVDFVYDNVVERLLKVVMAF